jgi:hypothetical protein
VRSLAAWLAVQPVNGASLSTTRDRRREHAAAVTVVTVEGADRPPVIAITISPFRKR